ncbi:MAG: protein kinase [Myxococcota bacterium]
MKVCPACGTAFPDTTEICPHDGTTLRQLKDPLVGKTVGGRYRLISRLGAGGMSSVYLARHVMIDRLVAVKTLRRDLAQDPVQRDRFIREARAVNRINHDNIVEITDFGETDDGLVYLVMEYVPGEPLLKALDEAPFPPARAIHIAEQIGRALGRAHQMGVVHRDLKPENVVLVARKSGKDFVKILDFGIAKILDAPSLTGSQQIFGTPGYIAPEYIQSTTIDGRADIYSLGVILYEMVTGALPFDYEYPGDLLVKHVTDPPIPPRQRFASVEEPLEAFILRCLEKEPENRFRDAYHFVDELKAAQERLGGASSWGGMNATESADSAAPTPVVDPDDSAALLRRTRPEGEPREPFEGEVTAKETPTIRESGVALAGFLEGERPDIPEPPSELASVSEELALQIATPDVAPVVTTESDEVLGLVGVVRWRDRFDALAAAIQSLGDEGIGLPDEVGDDLALSAETLRSLEGAVAEAENQQEHLEILDDQSRGLRVTLGQAIDDVGQDLSKARRALEGVTSRRDGLRARHATMAAEVRAGQASEGPADALLWELATVDQEVGRQVAACQVLDERMDELRQKLEEGTESLGDQAAVLVAEMDSTMVRVDALAEAMRVPLDRLEGFVRDAWERLDGPSADEEPAPSRG